MEYLLVDIESRLGNELAGFESGLPIDQPYRATSFQGSTSQALTFFYSPPRCLKFVDAETDALLPKKPRSVPKALHLSRVELIGDSAKPQSRLPSNIFGPEPAHGWCYYFQKADLASQLGEWQNIVRIGDQLFPMNDSSLESNSSMALEMMESYSQEGNWDKAAELVPFIQGYAHTGRWSQAQQLTMEAYRISPKLKYYLCSTWHVIQNTTAGDEGQITAVKSIGQNLECSFE